MIKSLEGVFLISIIIAIIGAYVFRVKGMNRVTNNGAISQTKFRFFHKREHFTAEGYNFMVVSYILMTYAISANFVYWFFIKNLFN